MELPVILPVLVLKIKATPLSDTEPAPVEGYKVVLVEDLGYTKLWMVFRVVKS